MDRLDELRRSLQGVESPPRLEAMPRRGLEDKGINGPTAAHVIEEVHTPFNLAFLTVTTGTTAFQNIVGVTHSELPGRIAAGRRALELAGVPPGGRLLVAYPPLVNVFPRQALEAHGVTWGFLQRSSRDALVLALCDEAPAAVIGESAFLAASLRQAVEMGLQDRLPRGTILIASGTPMDTALPELAAETMGAAVHDLYGCQEFGWLTLDGLPLREDIVLWESGAGQADLLVGGLPTGDRFALSDAGHLCNPAGRILTYARVRTPFECAVEVLQTTAQSPETIWRLCKSILRIKGRIAQAAQALVCGAPHTVLRATRPGGTLVLEGPTQTRLMDALLCDQLAYQGGHKNDPAWIKDR